MMGIQDYDCPQESVLIDTHEGYVLSDRKKTRKRKIAQFINLLLIGLGRPLADIFCKVIPHPGPIPNCLAVDHWLQPILSWCLYFQEYLTTANHSYMVLVVPPDQLQPVDLSTRAAP